MNLFLVLAPLVCMNQNVGSADRVARAVVGLALVVAAVLAPVSMLVRIGLMVVPSLYFLGTSVAGTCLGYRLMGRSTCPVKP